MSILKNDTAYSIADQCFASATTFIITLSVGRYSSNNEFGMFILLMTIWNFVFLLQNGMLSQNIIISYNILNENEKKSIIPLATYISLLAGILIFIILAFTELSKSTSILFCTAIAIMITKETARSEKISRLEYKKLLKLDGAYFFATLLTIIALIHIEKINNTFIWTTHIFSATIFFSLYRITNLKHTYKKKHLKELIKKTYSNSVWHGLSNIQTWASSNLFKYIIVAYLGIEKLAIVGACQNIVYISNPIFSGLQNNAVAAICKNKNIAREKLNIIIIFSVIIFISIYSFSYELLKIFYGNNYTEYSYILEFFSFNFIIISIGRILNIKLLYTNQIKKLFKLNIIYTPINIVSAFILISKFDLNGFCYYLIFSAFLFTTLSTLYAKK